MLWATSKDHPLRLISRHGVETYDSSHAALDLPITGEWTVSILDQRKMCKPYTFKKHTGQIIQNKMQD